MLKVERLPADHFQVFKAITRYAVVDRQTAYEALGYYGEKRTSKIGSPIKGYLTAHNKMPKKICTGREFRELIKKHIQVHYQPYGIPQGAPISDLLANLYMIDFDCKVLEWVTHVRGTYFRYSDDIILIVPEGSIDHSCFFELFRSLLSDFDTRLTIKTEKSAVFVFRKSEGDDQTVHHAFGTQGRNGLEYLGFRYQGEKVYLRDSTLSNLHRKISSAARRAANARRYPDKDALQLTSLFNYQLFVKKFGRVEDFFEKGHEYHNWTFWTYAKRAIDVMFPLGRPIQNQLRKLRQHIRYRIDTELERAVTRR